MSKFIFFVIYVIGLLSSSCSASESDCESSLKMSVSLSFGHYLDEPIEESGAVFRVCLENCGMDELTIIVPEQREIESKSPIWSFAYSLKSDYEGNPLIPPFTEMSLVKLRPGQKTVLVEIQSSLTLNNFEDSVYSKINPVFAYVITSKVEENLGFWSGRIDYEYNIKETVEEIREKLKNDNAGQEDK